MPGEALFREHGKQVAALCWRPSPKRASGIEVLLITSLNSKRWIMPKGWPEPDLSGSENAAREAFEEAGISGTIDADPLGSFHHKKRSLFGTVDVEILVHLLAVEKELTEWPERGQRERKWFPVKEAASVVDSDDLGELIARVGKRLKNGKKSAR